MIEAAYFARALLQDREYGANRWVTAGLGS